MDIKQQCARKALDYIENGMVIGLGGGSTIKHLISFLKESNKHVQIITPSWETKQHCIDACLKVLPTSDVCKVNVAFDGCDQVDEQLHALKSGGGIHTEEKLIANMADDYILLIDESKLVPQLTYDHPVVLEVLPQAMSYVRHQLESIPVSSATIRMSKDKDGAVVTDNGHQLLDVYVMPQQDACALEATLKGMTGVVDVSLFTSVVTKVLVASETGVRELT